MSYSLKEALMELNEDFAKNEVIDNLEDKNLDFFRNSENPVYNIKNIQKFIKWLEDCSKKEEARQDRVNAVRAKNEREREEDRDLPNQKRDDGPNRRKKNKINPVDNIKIEPEYVQFNKLKDKNALRKSTNKWNLLKIVDDENYKGLKHIAYNDKNYKWTVFYDKDLKESFKYMQFAGLNESFKINPDTFTRNDLDSIINYIRGQYIKFIDGSDSETGVVKDIQISENTGRVFVMFDLLGHRNSSRKTGRVSLAGIFRGETKNYKGDYCMPPVSIDVTGPKSQKVRELIDLYEKARNKDEFIAAVNDKLRVRYTGGNANIWDPANIQWINDHVTSIVLMLGDNETNNNRLQRMRDSLYADFPDIDIDDIAVGYNNDNAHVVAMKMTFSTKDLSTMPEAVQKLLSPGDKVAINNTNFIWELLRDHAEGYPNLYLGYKRK